MKSPLMQQAVGIAMRIYRQSPLYPRWGRRLAWLLGKVSRSRRHVVKQVGGLLYDLQLSEVIDSSIYYSGTFEEQTERTLETLAVPGRVAIDVGANVGYHTLRMARGVGHDGRVVAIEPMTQARQRLNRNLELNPHLTNVQVVAAGVSDAEAMDVVTFQSSYPLAGSPEMVEEEVRLTTLDTLVTELGLPRVDLVKIDVDGYEGKVFRGARETLRQWRPDIVFEFSPNEMRANGDDPEQLLESLEDLGYEIRHEDDSAISGRPDLLRQVGRYSVNLKATATGDG